MTSAHTEPPADGESREEIIDRVTDEQRDIYAATGSTRDRDVTTRRHLGTRAVAHGIVVAVIAGAVGAVVGMLFANAWIALPLAIVGFILGLLLTAERDDGVIATRVSEHQHQAVTSSSPETDVRGE